MAENKLVTNFRKLFQPKYYGVMGPLRLSYRIPGAHRMKRLSELPAGHQMIQLENPWKPYKKKEFPVKIAIFAGKGSIFCDFSGCIHPRNLTNWYQKLPCLKGVTLSKPSFWVSMLVFGSVFMSLWEASFKTVPLNVSWQKSERRVSGVKGVGT